MKKTLSIICALIMTCSFASCGNSDESKKIEDLEKKVSKLEEDMSKLSTTTATTKQTTTATKATTTEVTTTPETTTTVQTFDTTWYEFDEEYKFEAKFDVSIYEAPDKSSKILYEFPAGTVFIAKGRASSDWLVVTIDDKTVFVLSTPLKQQYETYTTTIIDFSEF